MPLLSSLDSLAAWRHALDRGVEQLTARLSDTQLLDAQALALAASVRQRLDTDRLVLAFVAEFSRGKSELINALFFGDAGQRVLPATPGRTTMCPVELAWDGEQAAALALLPIGSRSGGQTLASLRAQPELWHHLPLPVDDAPAMAQVLQQVVRTTLVSVDEARTLGFWSDLHPEDNPPRDAQDRVEVPAWRHALINYPHPLLKRGLVVVDTPGLNAIGAEPELTLTMLPSAHATVFLLAADSGVTRSDLAVWRDHLDGRGCERFVVLNKIDTLADPLLDAAQIEAQIQRQCEQVVQTLGVEPARVFPLSARQALAAKVQGDGAALLASRLPALEHALLSELLPQRSQLLGHIVEDAVLALQQAAQRRLQDRQRQTTEQLDELRGLRGKSASRLKLVRGRLDAEGQDFERCAPKLAALRSVLVRQLQDLLDGLGSGQVRQAVERMCADSGGGLLKRGMARAFTELGQQLRERLAQAGQRVDEIELMLQASQRSLNAEFGFALSCGQRPALDHFGRELARIEESYSRYVSLTQRWRFSQTGFMERFSQMLASRLRVVFEGAAIEIEGWAKAVGTQIDDQLRERRLAVLQRRDAFARIQSAENGLERGIAELLAIEAQQLRVAERLASDVDLLRILAATPPLPEAPNRLPHLQLVQPPAQPQPARGAA
jgi:hypothetical protein